jgi:hypothetical protein
MIEKRQDSVIPVEWNEIYRRLQIMYIVSANHFFNQSSKQ